MMKQLILMLLIVSVCVTAADNSITSKVAEAQANTQIDLIKDWRVICVLLILITIILVAAAYMAGQAFDMPELKGWASLEVSQVIATALLIAFLFVALAFIDGLMILLVQDSGLMDSEGNPLQCLPTEDCALKITSEYFNGMEFAMNLEVETLLKNAAEAGQDMGRRTGISGHTLIYPVPTLWGSYSMAWAPQNILHVERYNTVLEFYSGLFSSMYAQQFFIKQIVPNAAPLLLFLGIILRSFFVTRRLGGLLIAIALGVMIVFPLMYVFDWVTMRITIYGDKALEPEPVPVCPEACQTLPPIAFNKLTGEQYYDIASFKSAFKNQYPSDVYYDSWGDELSISFFCYFNPNFNTKTPYDPSSWDKFATFVSKDGSMTAEQIAKKYSLPFDFKTEILFPVSKSKTEENRIYEAQFMTEICPDLIASVESEFVSHLSNVFGYCFSDDNIFSSIDLPYDMGDYVTGNTVCPISCRELPYPFGKSECIPLNVQWACSQLPEQCKQNRTIPASEIKDLSQEYKDKIKKCDAQCKMIPPMKSNCMTGGGTLSIGTVGITAGEYGIKTKDDCRAITYKIFYMDEKYLDEQEKNAKTIAKLLCEQRYGDQGAFISAWGEPGLGIGSSNDRCLIYCNIIADECLSLPVECRVRMENEEQTGVIGTNKEEMTNDCPEKVVESCPAALNPEDSCVYVVPNEKVWGQCADCLLIDDGFTFEPPLATDCQQLCSDTNWIKTQLNPAQFAVKTKEGMVGRSEIKNAASFVIPLYVLPLLNILVTLMFIKTFSQILGGDIEIPGLQKVF